MSDSDDNENENELQQQTAEFVGRVVSAAIGDGHESDSEKLADLENAEKLLSSPSTVESTSNEYRDAAQEFIDAERDALTSGNSTTSKN